MQHSSVVGDTEAGLRGVRAPAMMATIRRISPAGWVRIGLLALFCAFYIWTAASSTPITFADGASGIHGQIADALLHGRGSLGDAPAGLTALPNPYDPEQNRPFRGQGLHDLSLYDGRIYAYWGPTPAVVLFGPARLLGIDFSQTLAVALFAFLGLLFSVMTLLTLVRRFAPATPGWQVNAGVVLLGFANVLPYAIRRPAQYEVSITAGLCFAMLAAWLLLSGVLRERPSLWRLAAGSLSLGLAVGARPSHTATAAGLVAVSAWLLRRTPKGERLRPALALLGPVGVCAVLLGLFNYVRFDSFAEFGLAHQLAGVDVTARNGFSLSYLLPGLWYYLVAPPRLLVIFPFITLPPPPAYPGPVPAVYDGVEPTGGLFVLAPVLFALLAAPFLRGRYRLERDLRAVLLALVAIAAALVVVAAIAFWGATMRYEVDFASFLLLAALMVWFCVCGVAAKRRRLLTIAGVVTVAWGSLLGLALGFTGSYVPLRTAHPGLWAALTKDFSLVSRAGAALTGGPTIAEVDAAGADRSGLNYTDFDEQGTAFWMDQDKPVSLRIVMPSSGEIHLLGSGERGPSGGQGRLDVVLALPDGRRVSVGPRSDGTFDVPLTLERGIQKVVLTARLPDAVPPQKGLLLQDVLLLKDVRVE